MKKLFPLAFILSFVFIACNNKSEPDEEQSSGMITSTSNFIRAALDGKFSDAKKLMLIDSANVQYLETAEKLYQNLDRESKIEYAKASIRILSGEEKIKDSIGVVIYSNSYKNNPDTLRVFKINNRWLVDLKYLYEHDYDTLMQKIRSTGDTLIKQTPKDSLQ